MKTLIFFFLFAMTTGFADQLVVDNQTSYPSHKGTKIAIQWAYSAQGVEEGNQALLHGHPLQNLQSIKKTGQNRLTVPQSAEYFRILVWSKEEDDPDLHTNWVETEDQKVYSLKQDQLVPAVLMSGTGC